MDKDDEILDFNTLRTHITNVKDDLGKTKDDLSKAKNTVVEDTDKNFNSNNLEEILKELFTFVVNGKTIIASAINDKSGSDEAKKDMTFEQLVQCIKDIEVGILEFKRTIKEIQTVDKDLIIGYVNKINANIENINLQLLDYIANNVNEVYNFDTSNFKNYSNMANTETISVKLS